MGIRYLTETSVFSGEDAERLAEEQIRKGYQLEGDVSLDDYNNIQKRIKAGEALVFFHVDGERDRLLRVFKK